MASLRVTRGLKRGYTRCIERSPLLTSAITGGTLAFAGDVVAQLGVERRDRLDLRRLAVFSTFGIGWSGCFNHFWYRKLAAMYPGTSFRSTAKKIVWNHGFSNPFLYLPTFFVSQGVLLGLDHERTVQKMREEYWPSLAKCWAIWIPANALIFTLVSLRYQVLATSSVALGWNTVLSLGYKGGELRQQAVAPRASSTEEEEHQGQLRSALRLMGTAAAEEGAEDAMAPPLAFAAGVGAERAAVLREEGDDEAERVHQRALNFWSR